MLSSCQSEKIGGEGGALMVDYMIVYVHSSHRIIHVYGQCKPDSPSLVYTGPGTRLGLDRRSLLV